MTRYNLIVGNTYSLSDETNGDIMTDYFPGLWAISSQSQALKYAKEYLERGDTVKVVVHNNRYNEIANRFIEKLGLSQDKLPVPEKPKSTATTAPANLSQFKKYVQEGTLFHTVHHKQNEEDTSRDAEVIEVGGSYFVSNGGTRTPGGKVWMEYGKAGEWSFHDDRAINYTLDSEGDYKPSVSFYYKAR